MSGQEYKMPVKALVLRTAGTNCDRETVFALESAGADVSLVHINRLAQEPRLLRSASILVLPGGFTYGDDVAAGKVMAIEIAHTLRDVVEELVARGGLVLGICNGFQILVKTGLLPGGKFAPTAEREATLFHNTQAHFESRWVRVKADSKTKCVFVEADEQMEIPIAHGEGQFILRDANMLSELVEKGQVVYRYVNEQGEKGVNFPSNPNGSLDAIAGICDPTGRIFGLMPHPERHIFGHQHPRWTRENQSHEGAGMRIFRRAVNYIRSVNA